MVKYGVMGDKLSMTTHTPMDPSNNIFRVVQWNDQVLYCSRSGKPAIQCL